MATRIFGREPALWLTFVATAVRLFSAFVVDLSADQQAVLNAVAAAVAGFVIAKAVHRGQPAAVLGLVHALLALGVGFGANIGAEAQAVIMSFVGAVLAMFVRTQVIAPVPVNPVPTPVPGGSTPID
jgi:hypothetical protein